MSKADLRIRPIYHHKQHRIEVHICIAFSAHCVYKELARDLYKKSSLSFKNAVELTYNSVPNKIYLTAKQAHKINAFENG